MSKKKKLIRYIARTNLKVEIVLQSLHEKCQNTELFLALIFLHSDWIRRDTKYLSIFSPNAGKYGPKMTPYLDTFHAVNVQ